MKRLFIVLLLLCFLPVFALANEKGFGRYAMDAVNVRESPGGDILFKKQKGEELFILSSKESGGHTWYEVNTYDDRRIKPFTAWVRSDMVVPPWELFTDVVQVAADDNLMIALKKDGTAVMGGEMHKYPHLMQGQFPDAWQHVKQVATGRLTVYGIKEDGGLYKWGLRGPQDGMPGMMNLDGNMVGFAAIDALDAILLAQMEDGSLHSFYSSTQVTQLMPPGSGVTDFSAGLGIYEDAVFVRDGQVTSMSVVHDSIITPEDREALAQWQNIVKVEAGFRSPWTLSEAMADFGYPMLVGVESDGTVTALDAELNREVGAWTDVVDVECGDGYLIGLHRDGTVVAAGERKHLVSKDIASWTGIVDIACGRSFCVGVTRDGRVLFAGEVQFAPS